MILHNLSARINKSSLVFVSFNINIVSTHSTGPRLVFLFAHASQCCCCVLPAGEWAMFPVVMVGGGRDTGPGSDTSPPLPSSLTPALQRILPATGPRPTPGTGHITLSLTHPGPLSLSWQQNIRKVLQLLRTEERFSAARIFPVLTVLTS